MVIKAPKADSNDFRVSLSTQSVIFEAFGDDEKLTITELIIRLNDGKEPSERLSDRTIRRAIYALEVNGFLKKFGREGNAYLYGKPAAAFNDNQSKLINFGGELKSIESFLATIVGEDEKPLQKGKVNILSREIEHHIRRRLAFVVISAGNPGMNEQLKKTVRELHSLLTELKYVENVLQSFLDSPVWYEQYREGMAVALRRFQEKDPSLFQTTIDYVRSEG